MPELEIQHLSKSESSPLLRLETGIKEPEIDERPSICGGFSNWLPKKMYKIEDYTKMQKNHSIDFIYDRMHKMGLAVDRSVRDPILLDYAMKMNFKEIAEEYDNEFLI